METRIVKAYERALGQAVRGQIGKTVYFERSPVKAGQLERNVNVSVIPAVKDWKLEAAAWAIAVVGVGFEMYVGVRYIFMGEIFPLFRWVGGRVIEAMSGIMMPI